ncbi:MAG: DNA repair protein RecO [Prevotella sp.]
MQIKTRAIVLHTLKYGDSKLIVDLLTSCRGRISCIMRISQSSKARLKKQYFQPLFILDLVIDERPKSNLQHIKDVHIAVPFISIPFEPYKLSTALFIAEFIRGIAHNEDTDEIAFNYIENSIRWLDSCTKPAANFHLVFMMRMSKFLGFYPNVNDYEDGSWFDMRSGNFCKNAPLHHDRLPPEEAIRIRTMLRMNYPTMHLFRMSRTERNHLLDIIMAYYHIHIPTLPEIKSTDVLKELFNM